MLYIYLNRVLRFQIAEFTIKNLSAKITLLSRRCNRRLGTIMLITAIHAELFKIKIANVINSNHFISVILQLSSFIAIHLNSFRYQNVEKRSQS